jgi:hypothetical protein
MTSTQSTKLIRQIILIVAVLGFLFACKKQHDSVSSPGTTSNVCSGPAKSFANDVNPIFQASCAFAAGCHGNGSVNGPGELTSYSKIFNARSDIRSAISSGEMPLNSSLSATEKNAILCWIDNGAPNN